MTGPLFTHLLLTLPATPTTRPMLARDYVPGGPPSPAALALLARRFQASPADISALQRVLAGPEGVTLPVRVQAPDTPAETWELGHRELRHMEAVLRAVGRYDLDTLEVLHGAMLADVPAGVLPDAYT